MTTPLWPPTPGETRIRLGSMQPRPDDPDQRLRKWIELRGDSHLSAEDARQLAAALNVAAGALDELS
jgi:hypothetical protein